LENNSQDNSQQLVFRHSTNFTEALLEQIGLKTIRTKGDKTGEINSDFSEASANAPADRKTTQTT
jgi:hypothetical protein